MRRHLREQARSQRGVGQCMIQLSNHNPSINQMIPMINAAFMNARIADHNNTNPTIRVMMLMMDVSMPSASDKPSTKWLLARLTS